MAALTARFGEASKGAFGIGNMEFKPFSRAKSLLAYRMSLPTLIPVVGINVLILSAAIIGMVLQLATTLSNWGINAIDYDDASSYGLLLLSVPLMMQSIGCLLAAFGGRLFFIDFWGQLLFFIAVTVTTVLGWFGGVIAEIISWGRFDACLTNEKHSDYCHDEKNALLAVALITLALLLLSLANMFFASLLLFVRPIQYSAVGMDRETMRKLKKLNGNPTEARNVYNLWLTNKQRGDAGLPALSALETPGDGETVGLFSGAAYSPVVSSSFSGSSSSSSSVGNRITAAHRAVAAQAIKGNTQ